MRYYLKFSCFLAAVFIFSSCHSTRTKESLSPENDPALIRKNEAALFDMYINNGFSNADLKSYKESCADLQNPSKFCIIVRDRNRLEVKTEQEKKKKNKRANYSILPIKITKKKIANWLELRFANTSTLIRTFNRVPLNQVEAVRTYALKEKKCPNNAALAIASRYEEFLPDKISFFDVAKLYEKAALCPSESKDTAESLWTRTGLFYLSAKKTQEANHAFEKASKTKASFTARSLYWLYKTKLDLGKNSEAQDTLKTLREEYPFSFHTLMAVSNRNEDPGKALEGRTYEQKKRSDSNTDINLLIEQGEVLREFGFNRSASILENWAMSLAQKEGESELMVYLSDLKGEEGDHLSQISVLSEVLYSKPELVSKTTLEKYFPKPYFPIFQNNASGIDPYLLLAIARRESGFNPKAVSSANARGLLQLMPQTARRISSEGDLFDPNSNIDLGAKLVGELLQRVNGQVHLALAAYNAGVRRVATWTSRYPIEDPILFIDLIPFKETREYVAAVLRNYYWYRKLDSNAKGKISRPILEYEGLDSIPAASDTNSVRPIQAVPE